MLDLSFLGRSLVERQQSAGQLQFPSVKGAARPDECPCYAAFLCYCPLAAWVSFFLFQVFATSYLLDRIVRVGDFILSE